jgi:hypothetical protein
MTGSPVPTLSVRVPDDLAVRFDAAAAAFGGRSARLRQLILADGGPVPSATPQLRARRDGARIMVRLEPSDAAALAAEAVAMRLTRASWVAALVRRRLRGKPAFGRPDELSLIAIQTELRRIGVNVNQIARALNTAVLEGKVLELEIAYLDDLRTELQAHLFTLREAFEGNLVYWDAEP